jgi:hypothetical protein
MRNGIYSKTRPLLLLIGLALLSVCVYSCGGTGKSTSSASTAPSSAVTHEDIVGDGQTASTPKHEPVDSGNQNDDNINGYGHEASAADRRAIAALVKRYYAAAATDNGAKACSMVYSIFAESIPEDYGKPPGPPAFRGLKTCAAVVSKLFKMLPGQPPSVLYKTEVTGVRLYGNHGFAQLHSSAIPTGKFFVERERGVWKAGTLIGVACTSCGA